MAVQRPGAGASGNAGAPGFLRPLGGIDFEDLDALVGSTLPRFSRVKGGARGGGGEHEGRKRC